MMAIHYEKLSIKAHLHCDKTIKANKLSYAWFCYWKAFNWKIEIWLKSDVLKGIWLEKLKFGLETWARVAWLWNLVELWWIMTEICLILLLKDIWLEKLKLGLEMPDFWNLVEIWCIEMYQELHQKNDDFSRI